jgi:UDP-N-acetylglucosamine 4-epimerase
VELPHVQGVEPVYGEFRAGDVRHSQADIGKAETLLGYAPAFDVAAGLKVTANWFLARSHSKNTKDNNA